MIRKNVILLSSVLLALLIAIVSLFGLLTPGFYAKETPSWQAQSLGQDLADLILVIPALIVTAVLSYQGNKKALLFWGGTLIYIVYTFLIYCFGVHFNRLFLFYCIILGIASYSLLYFFYLLLQLAPRITHRNTAASRTIACYLLIISGLFYFLWLSEIIPASLNQETPSNVLEVGLPTNPVHVLDISLLLPAIFITGILLFRRNSFALLLAPALLIFFVLMNCTIGGLALMMNARGITSSLMLVWVMGILAVISLLGLTWYFHRAISMNE